MKQILLKIFTILIICSNLEARRRRDGGISAIIIRKLMLLK